MKRVHLFEFTDMPQCPSIFRNMITDFIRNVMSWSQPYKPKLALILKVFKATKNKKIIDLCSGGGGAWLHLHKHLERELKHPVEVILTDKFPDKTITSSIELPKSVTYHEEPVDALVGVATLFKKLCENDDFGKLNFSHFKTTFSGGMSLPSETAERWRSLTGCRPAECYGMTEASPVIAMNPPDNIHPGTVGTVVKGTCFRVVDGDGKEVPLGSVGELLIQGPQVMKGYWNQKEETDQHHKIGRTQIIEYL